jgi:hypothetical protein
MSKRTIGPSPAAHKPPSSSSLLRQVVESPGRPLDSSARGAMEPRFGDEVSSARSGVSRPSSAFTVSGVNDPFEREADAVAGRAMRRASPGAATADFSRVRVHTDTTASDAARSLNARAFTVGGHIGFAEGEYAPSSVAGQRLLAHELAHVLQQGRAPSARVFRWPMPMPPAPAGAETPAKAAPPEYADTLDYDAIAAELKRAMKGWGTDEEGVYFALNRLRRDPEAVKRLRQVYQRKYQADLIDDIVDDFSGSELEYALQLINAGKPGSGQAIDASEPKTQEEFVKAAERVRKAVERAGTDEEAVYAVLTPFQRRVELLDKLKAVYEALYKENLEDRIRSEMRGSERDYALWLLGRQTLERNLPDAEKQLAQVHAFIKTEAQKRARTPESIDPTSKFYQTLRTRYLAGYFANPTAGEGKKAAEEGVGRPMEGKIVRVGNRHVVHVRPKGGGWRPAMNNWEAMGITWLNQQQLPSQIDRLKSIPMFKHLLALPRQLGAATDILIDENTATLPYLDIPFLLGAPNPEKADFDADWREGGKNISQLMHWGSGVKYAAQKPEALRELFLAYELWHLEGFDVFGQDSLNDLISENQGRMLGAELMKGSAGALKTEADLLPFLNRSFRESRAWVGALLRFRRPALDAWILAKEQKRASFHWMKKEDMWHSRTVYQMLADKMPLEEVKTSFMVESQIEIYTLVFEADEWEKANGPIVLTDLEKALLSGKLDKILEVMAKAEEGKASYPELLKAKSAIDDMKK